MIKLLRGLFFLDAIFWLAFAVATYLRILPGIPDQGAMAGVMAALMLGNAAALAVAGWGLCRRDLGKALLAEGLRHLQRMGATRAFVGGHGAAANPLYRAVMGPAHEVYEVWVKVWPAS